MMEILINAINKIGKEYYSTTNPTLRNGKVVSYSQNEVDLEQRFVMELHHQLRLKLDGSRFLLDGEIQKQICHKAYPSDSNYGRTIKALLGNCIKPDLLFHKGQQFNDPEDQILALECKFGALSPDKFNKDFFKLMVYDIDLKFKNSVFLIIKNKKEAIEEHLRNYVQADYFIADDLERIKVLYKEDFDSKVTEIDIKGINEKI